MKRVFKHSGLSCLGKCSLNCGSSYYFCHGNLRQAFVPTAVLSTHTKFNNFTFRDLTDDMEGNKKSTG